jgi:ribosomal RNA assembly protein
MQEIYIEEIGNVLKNKSKLEKQLKVKITNQGKNFFVDGDGDKEYIALKVLEALDLGFSLGRALLLKKEDVILQTINIKDLTKRSDLHSVRARVIGTYGSTLTNLSKLTDCALAMKDNVIGIIGEAELMDEAKTAVEILIRGSKQANVYARLEKKKKDRRLNPKETIKNEMKKRGE